MRRLALILLGLLLLVGAAAAADTLTLPAADPSVNQHKDINVLLSAENGLSGYNITFTVENDTVARIASVTFPAWASLHSASTVPAANVTIVGADLGNQVTAPANTLIATLAIEGRAVGTTTITATVNQLDDDAGGTITPTITNGTITVTSSLRPPATSTIAPVSTALSVDLLGAIGGEEIPEPGDEAIDWTALIGATAGAYTAPLGPLAYVIIFAIPFLMMWITQRDMTLPGIVGALLGLFIIIRLPAEFHLVATTFIAISIVAVVYSLVKERA